MEYNKLTEDDFEKMLAEQRAQLEYALAVFDATAVKQIGSMRTYLQSKNGFYLDGRGGAGTGNQRLGDCNDSLVSSEPKMRL